MPADVSRDSDAGAAVNVYEPLFMGLPLYPEKTDDLPIRILELEKDAEVELPEPLAVPTPSSLKLALVMSACENVGHTSVSPSIMM